MARLDITAGVTEEYTALTDVLVQNVGNHIVKWSQEENSEAYAVLDRFKSLTVPVDTVVYFKSEYDGVLAIEVVQS